MLDTLTTQLVAISLALLTLILALCLWSGEAPAAVFARHLILPSWPVSVSDAGRVDG